MKKVLVFFVCFLFVQVRVMAQDIQVQPSPRQVNVTGKSMTIPYSSQSASCLQGHCLFRFHRVIP